MRAAGQWAAHAQGPTFSWQCLPRRAGGSATSPVQATLQPRTEGSWSSAAVPGAVTDVSEGQNLPSLSTSMRSALSWALNRQWALLREHVPVRERERDRGISTSMMYVHMYTCMYLPTIYLSIHLSIYLSSICLSSIYLSNLLPEPYEKALRSHIRLKQPKKLILRLYFVYSYALVPRSLLAFAHLARVQWEALRYPELKLLLSL